MSRYSSREALERILADFQGQLHTTFPAQVESYDASAQTVDLKPAIRREVSTDNPEQPFVYEKLPVLRSIPVMWPRAGGFAMTFPVAVGDWMLVVCSEQSTLAWRRTGQPHSIPALNDPHGLNGCFALPGAFPDKLRLGHFDPNSEDEHSAATASTSAWELRSEDGSIKLKLSQDDSQVEGEDGAPAYGGGRIELDVGGFKIAVNRTLDGSGQVSSREINLGGDATALVALANLVTDQLDALKTAITEAATGTQDGGATFKANLLANLESWPESVAATVVKAK